MTDKLPRLLSAVVCAIEVMLSATVPLPVALTEGSQTPRSDAPSAPVAAQGMLLAKILQEAYEPFHVSFISAANIEMSAGATSLVLHCKLRVAL